MKTQSLHGKRNTRIPVNDGAPDITANVAASSTVSADSNNKGNMSSIQQSPISSSASIDLSAKNVANKRSLVNLMNRKHFGKMGVCRGGGASYNNAYSIHSKIIQQVDAWCFLTIAFVIIQMSVYQTSSVYSGNHYNICQIAKSNNKQVLVGQTHKRINDGNCYSTHSKELCEHQDYPRCTTLEEYS